MSYFNGTSLHSIILQSHLPVSTSAYFGTHFLLGGERYEVAKPEAFLFGENSDLSLYFFRYNFPYSRQPISDPVRTLNALVNLRRDSLKLVRQKNENRIVNGISYSLEFFFDCDSACRIQLHFFAKEVVSNGQIRFLYKNPSVGTSDQYFFDVGAEQQFTKFTFDMRVHNLMNYDGGAHFPLIIELHTVDCGIEQVQLTVASIDRSTDQSSTFIIKPLRQKLIADGVIYLLQEIYGIENKDHDLGEENGAECIICMSDIRDTLILPCRHLCICNGCAETLRYKLNNCPICRSPFRALLQLKTMRVVSTVSITDQTAASQQTRSQTR
ncbi:unnamed protein product [Dracunculus medinensis]|uniref:RING-type E3 ubiquitin transferase n=1 Tax=Dracunculus medinensis TaxID=318479 RepID=A0A0N4U9C0_DRAME|nr:unnamed protein product [Dracunculus medinensis]